MIELKNLHDRFLMHQAFVAAAAAAAAAALNYNQSASTSNNSSGDNLDISTSSTSIQTNSSSSNATIAALLSNHLMNSSPTTIYQASNTNNSTTNKTNYHDSDDDDDVDENDEEYIELEEEDDEECQTSKKRHLNNYSHISKRFKQDFSTKRKINELNDNNADLENDENNHKRIKPMNTNRKASSFLISDILGLDSVHKTNEINSEHFLQQYQNSLKQSYFSSLVNAASQSEFYRMISGSNFINETNKPLTSKLIQETPAVSPILNVSSMDNNNTKKPICSPIVNKSIESNQNKPAKNSILSSLEQLTKNQFQDDIGIKNKFLNNSNNLPVKKQDQIKKIETDNLPVKPEISNNNNSNKNDSTNKNGSSALPAWVFCTRYSDRPSAGPRHRKKSKVVTSNNIKAKAESSTHIQPQQQQTASINNKIDSNKANNNLSYSSSSSSSSSNSSFTYSPSLSSSNKSTSSPTYLNLVKNVADNIDNNKQQDKLDVKTEANDYDNNNEDRNQNIYDDDDDDDDSNSSSSKRPRTAFTGSQLNRLKNEFEKCKYLTGEKRQYLANELNLNESQIKIWFQNKRAKIKKSSGVKNNLALQLMAQGLYNHGSGSINGCDD